MIAPSDQCLRIRQGKSRSRPFGTIRRNPSQETAISLVPEIRPLHRNIGETGTNMLMADDRFDKLTEGQRACLRLVYARWEIKEIARKLGIAPVTVNQRLAAARRVLGTARSADAARMLAAHEQGTVYTPPIYRPDDLAEQPVPALAPGHTGESEGTATPAPVQPEAGQRGIQWPFATADRPRNQLTVPQRLVWMVVIAAGSMIAFGVMVSGMETLGRLF